MIFQLLLMQQLEALMKANLTKDGLLITTGNLLTIFLITWKRLMGK